MPNSLFPIPRGTPIVAPKSGAINIFFRQWIELVRTLVGVVPTVGSGYDAPGGDLSAGLAGQVLYTTPVAGRYRVTYYLRKTVADGVSSSLTFVWHWTERAIPHTKNGTPLTTDTTGAVESESKMLTVDANTNLTFDVTYASNTPGQMQYLVSVRVELMN